MLESKAIINQKVQSGKENIQRKIKESKDELSNTIKHITLSQEETNKKIKNIFAKKSIFHKRLTEAFPTLKVNFKVNKGNNEKSRKK